MGLCGKVTGSEVNSKYFSWVQDRADISDNRNIIDKIRKYKTEELGWNLVEACRGKRESWQVMAARIACCFSFAN